VSDAKRHRIWFQKNHAPLVFTTATPKPCLRPDSNHHHDFQIRHRERPAARQRLEQEQEHRTVDDELGDNDRKRGNALEGEHLSNDTGLDHQPRVAPSWVMGYWIVAG